MKGGLHPGHPLTRRTFSRMAEEWADPPPEKHTHPPTHPPTCGISSSRKCVFSITWRKTKGVSIYSNETTKRKQSDTKTHMGKNTSVTLVLVGRACTYSCTWFTENVKTITDASGCGCGCGGVGGDKPWLETTLFLCSGDGSDTGCTYVLKRPLLCCYCSIPDF